MEKLDWIVYTIESEQKMELTSVFSHRSVSLSYLCGVTLDTPLRHEGVLAVRSVITRQTIQTTFQATEVIEMVAAYSRSGEITDSFRRLSK